MYPPKDAPAAARRVESMYGSDETVSSPFLATIIEIAIHSTDINPKAIPRSVEAPLESHAACATGTLNVLDQARPREAPKGLADHRFSVAELLATRRFPTRMLLEPPWALTYWSAEVTPALAINRAHRLRFAL